MNKKEKPAVEGPRAGENDVDGMPQNMPSLPICQDDISTFQGINKRPTGITTWQEVLKDLRSDKYRKAIEKVRVVLHKFGCESAEYRKVKTQLDAVTFGGVFSPHRAKINIASPTGFIIPDLDHLNDKMEVVFNLLTQDPNVWFVFRSPSGEGLKVGIRSQNIKNDEDHKKLYFAIETCFKDVYGLTIDPACKDISRLTFMSHDPKSWINPDPQYFNISEWEKPLPGWPQPAIEPPDFKNSTGKKKCAEKVLQSCCEQIQQSLPTTQHNIRLKKSRQIGGYLHQYISEEEVLPALEQAVRDSGAKDMRAAMKTVRDGIAYGKLSPITIPDIEPGQSHTGQVEMQNDSSPTEKSSFDIAKEQYPRASFPWDVLPKSISISLQQLARSCATSPTSLPGAATAIFASTIGNTANMYPKKSWREPFIFWFGDIRPSGECKTPPPRALMHVLYEAQRMANDAYKTALELWEISPKQKRGKPPEKPRGFFVTDLTLEGLRVDHSGHGGKVCVLDELSSFLTSQNQYKNKGSDRESWLCLYDGNPARVVRAKETLTLTGCRISVFGGIQPEIWQKIFSENGGLHLVDGTIYRFLPTYEGRSYHPLTKESWSDDNKKAWESLLRDALSWADNQEKPKKLKLSDDAQETFFEWRNDLFQTKDDLPAQVQGFIPKLVGYALRFAGVLYLMHRFSQGREMGDIIHDDYIEKGIRVSEFYLGHIICAMEALAGDASSPLEFTEQVIHLAKTLEGLKPELDSGRLAIGYIHKKFNESCKPELNVKTAKAMGSLLRKCKLTIPEDRFDANGRRGVFCLQWDEKTKYFIETSPQSPQSPQSQEYQGLQPVDIEKLKSAKSASADVHGDDLRILRTLKKQSPQPVTGTSTNIADITDITDDFSKEIKNNGFEDTGAYCTDCDEDVL